MCVRDLVIAWWGYAGIDIDADIDIDINFDLSEFGCNIIIRRTLGKSNAGRIHTTRLHTPTHAL